MYIVEEMLTVEQLTTILIILPFLAAIFCYLIRALTIRSIVVLIAGGVLIISAVLLIPLIPFSLSPQPFWGVSLHVIVQVLEFLLLLIILYLGFKHRHLVIKALALLQIILLLYFEFFLIQNKQGTGTLYCDHLTLVMVLIISIVGAIICFQAIPYIKTHEEHWSLVKSRQHQFFLVMILFLGAMNGLVLSNDLMIFYFFFELTTLCSFLLIGHDKTKPAIKNAVRALWMNRLGGRFSLPQSRLFAR
jgi:ech hydrogenase subunit A